jgi:hypothetical protein
VFKVLNNNENIKNNIDNILEATSNKKENNLVVAAFLNNLTQNKHVNLKKSNNQSDSDKNELLTKIYQNIVK